MNDQRSHDAAAAARALAAAGFAVLPVARDKRPLTRHGYLDATRDPSEIAHLFATTDAPLIGVATGTPSNAAVLDLDGPEGRAWLAAHQARLPETLTVTTRRGGTHLWFRLAGMAPPPSTAGRIAPGVDTRGRAGYAVAWDPAALIAGRARMAPWPAWLTALLEPPPSPPMPPLPPVAAAGHDRYAMAALRRGVERVAMAREGSRNDALNREAWSLARLIGRGLDATLIREALGVAARVAGLGPREADATIGSALRARGAR